MPVREQTLKPSPAASRAPRRGVLQALACAVPVLLAACSTPPPQREPLAAALGRLVLATAAGLPPATVALLRVEAPRLGLSWQHGAGNLVAGTVAPAQSLRIASNTKPFVAAAVLRLAEDGRLELDAPLARWWPPASVEALRAAGYEVDRITPRMLLRHTGGLRDYAGLQSFLDRVDADPGRRWTRAEQLAIAMADGPPLFEPGTGFHYSDTGYILLGELLEQVTGQPMPVAIAGLLDGRRLGLRHTWFETLEPVPAGAPARAAQWFGDRDVASFDASIDLYGGGGLVSTPDDLVRFYRGLVRGEVFRQRTTVDVMLRPSVPSTAGGGPGYGMGIGRIEHAGLICHGHGGFWGTDVWHCPDIDLTVAAAVTSTRARKALRAMTLDTIRLVVQASPKR